MLVSNPVRSWYPKGSFTEFILPNMEPVVTLVAGGGVNEKVHNNLLVRGVHVQQFRGGCARVSRRGVACGRMRLAKVGHSIAHDPTSSSTTDMTVRTGSRYT